MQQTRFEGNFVYFITTVVQDRIKFFDEPIFCELFIDDLKLCKELKHFKLYSFNVLLDHVHLMIHPNEKYNISKVMQAIKINFSREINKLLGYKPGGEKSISRLRAVDLTKYYELFYKKNNFNHTFPKFRWQQSFHDHIIRDEQDFNTHMNYVWFNAMKHNVPNAESYKYSSYNNYSDLIDEYEI